MASFLPPPDQSSGHSHSRHRRRGPKFDDARIPSVEEIARMIMNVNGLVLLGIIPTARANTVQRGLRILLDIQMKGSQTQALDLPYEALAEVCRSHPKLLKLLEPFFPDELLEELLGGLQDEDDEV